MHGRMIEMKKTNRIKLAFKGLIDAITRFPLTSLFLLAAAALNSIAISNNEDYSKILLTLAVGAILGSVAQVAFERFFYRPLTRIVLTGAAAFLTLGYYIIILPAPELSTEIGLRTFVALFALFIAFIWLPSIKSVISFNDSFMGAFKGLFIALFFAVILFGGISLIITATNELLFQIDSDAYSHAANIIFIIFAPIYFLSIIPVYNGKSDEYLSIKTLELKEEKVQKAIACPKYLEILISYIVIPLTAVFSLILAAYIVINVGNNFWTDNLLEPMFVSYSITVILVYILSSSLGNKFAILFRKIFPKVLVPIAAFQTISSIMRAQDSGITHNRYFVIIFGIFAIASGLLFSFLSVSKNGIIAAILIVLSAVAIIPPTDAFTISRNNQISIVDKVLLKNNMLENNSIKQRNSIPNADKERLVGALQYLNMMGYTSQIPYLPAEFNYYSDFEKTFGFSAYANDPEAPRFAYLSLEANAFIDIAGYDTMTKTSININVPEQNNSKEIIGTINKAGENFTLQKLITYEECILALFDEAGQEIISFSTKEVFDNIAEKGFDRKDSISVEEATFSVENDKAAITIVLESLNMEVSSDTSYYGADIILMIRIN